MDMGLLACTVLQGLTGLTSVALKECGLKKLPWQLTGLSALTSLDLSRNEFRSRELDRWQWWPATMSR
jgi:hypothetical protein